MKKKSKRLSQKAASYKKMAASYKKMQRSKKPKIEEPQPRIEPTNHWFASLQDSNSRTAYVKSDSGAADCLKVETNFVKCDEKYRGTLTISGPNETFIVLTKKSGEIMQINAHMSDRLKELASNLILLANELCPARGS